MKFSEISKFRLTELRAELKKRGVESRVLKQKKQQLFDHLVELLRSVNEFEDDSEECASAVSPDISGEENVNSLENIDVKTEETTTDQGSGDVFESTPRPSLREQLAEQDTSETAQYDPTVPSISNEISEVVQPGWYAEGSAGRPPDECDVDGALDVKPSGEELQQVLRENAPEEGRRNEKESSTVSSSSSLPAMPFRVKEEPMLDESEIPHTSYFPPPDEDEDEEARTEVLYKMEPDDEDAEVNQEVARLTFQGADEDDEGSRGIEIIEEKLMKNFVIPRADVFGRRRSSSEGSQNFYDDIDDDFQDDVFSEGSEVDDDLLDETEGGKDTMINEAQVRMDNYRCHLNLKVYQPQRLICEAMHQDGFALMWAGGRASYGVFDGRVAFEVKVLAYLHVTGFPNEPNLHGVRVGWSTDHSPFQLGESPNSFGYDNAGQKCTNNEFGEYGGKFGDFHAGTIEYWKNGQALGKAFDLKIPAKEEKYVLYPHVSLKNTKVQLNFGARDQPWFPVPDDLVLIDDVHMDRRKPIAEPPLEKRDCKLICMIGLPGCGKTTWIREFIKQNPEDLWYVLGTDQLLDQMRVFGESRKKNYPGRWDVLIGMAYKCLLKLLQIACRRERNYIVDQTNVFPEARRRKMVPFREFHRSAVVIVPNEKDYHQRCFRQSVEEGKAIPPEAIMEMKAHFTIPEDDDGIFKRVEFVELDRAEAEAIISQYNEEAKAYYDPHAEEKRWKLQQEEHSPIPLFAQEDEDVDDEQIDEQIYIPTHKQIYGRTPIVDPDAMAKAKQLAKVAPLPAPQPVVMHGYAGWAATPVNPNLQRSLDEKCPVCKEMGHWYHDCPKNLCYICKDRGHWQNDCPLRLIMTDEELAHRKSPSNMCYLCGDYGHWQQECPHRPKEFLTADAPAPGPWRVEVVPKHSLKRKQQTGDETMPAKERKGPVTPPGTPPPDMHMEPCC